MLGATMQFHLDHQPEKVQDTVQVLKDNTSVDNIMQIGGDVSELQKFKVEATEILESAKLPLHKWESNVESLESEGRRRKTCCTFQHQNILATLKLQRSLW